MKAIKKPRRHQKLTAGRTKVSRYARAVRRAFFNVQMELEFLKANPKHTTPAELAKAQRRFARQLEVSRAVALAELDDSDEDGEDE